MNRVRIPNTGRRARRPISQFLRSLAVAVLVAPAVGICRAQAPQSSGEEGSLAELSAVACRPAAVSSPISLIAVIERAMCESPKTRSTWASINQAVANVDLSKAAFWPSVQGDVRYLYQHNSTQTESADLESNYAKGVNEETLTLSWVLYDFGARVSSLDNGRALLAAAEANQNATLQEVFRHAAQDYFSAQAAQATVISKRTIERGAQQNLDAARTRVTRGVAPVTDELQAKTAAAQATFERVKAEGGLRAALGALAVDMSLSPDEDLVLPEMEQGALPNEDFVKRVHDLLEDARRNHPKILAAAAEWQSALANVRFARTHRLPSVRLVGESNRSNQPVSASLGQPELPALSKENYIGVEIQIPIFDGLSRRSEIHQAQAQAEMKRQEMRDAEQQVTIDIWSSVQTLQTDTENLRNTDVVMQSARDAYEASEERYRSGVGNIIEALSAQRALSTSEEQSIQARLDWRNARLQLASSLGQMGMSIVR